MRCPQCGTQMPAANNFCEDCGTALATPPPAAHAPGAPAPGGPAVPGSAAAQTCVGQPCPGCQRPPTEIDAQGFCTCCGLQRRSPQRDHMEVVLDGGAAAAVCDRGLRIFRNEDFVALARGAGGLAAVVCDGVSNSRCPDQAS